MPHVNVKMYPGRSEEVKARLAEELLRTIVAVTQCSEDSVSVALEDVAPQDWAKAVYEPDIRGKPKSLYKKPGYTV